MSKFTASVSVSLANVSLASGVRTSPDCSSSPWSLMVSVVPQLRPAERTSALVSAMNTDKKLNHIVRSLPAMSRAGQECGLPGILFLEGQNRHGTSNPTCLHMVGALYSASRLAL